MEHDSDASQVNRIVAVGAISFAIIAARCIYRAYRRCHKHDNCFRSWHSDDSWIMFAIIPLVGRTACIAWSFALESQITTITSSQQPGNATGLENKQALALKLLIPSRVFYAMFIWCVKFSLLALYERVSKTIPGYRIAALVLRISFYITFIALLFPTLLECRPITLFWNGDPQGDKCRKARGNLSTMAAFNLATDLALFIFPLPLLWKIGLDWKRKLPLAVVFGIGSLVMITTLVRLPLILRDNVQNLRTLWADIEIMCASIVANASFYYALFRDLRQHSESSRDTSIDRQRTHSSIPGEAIRRRFNSDEETLRQYGRALVPNQPIVKGIVQTISFETRSDTDIALEENGSTTQHIEDIPTRDKEDW